MSDFDDDEEPYIPPQKHAAKSTENDNAALLSYGNEREEYTDIFDEGGGTGEVVASVDFEDGESVSASDDEIAGYTGDLENYTESEIDPPVLKNSSSTLHIPEGNLININDSVIIEETVIAENDGEREQSHSDRPIQQAPQKSTKTVVTNETISEIAVKLNEVGVTPTNIAKPGKLVKVMEETDLDKKHSVSDGGDISSGDTSKGNSLQSQDRRKKYRKRTTSYASVDNEEILSSSGEYRADHDQLNGHSLAEHKHKPRKKRDKNKQEEILNADNTTTNSTAKLIDIETPPVTPYQAVVENTSSKKASSRSSNTTKRKKTRHKVYLDDPDVHQLISDQIQLLQKYAEDLKSGNYTKRQPTLIAGRHNTQKHPMSGQGSSTYNKPPHQYNQHSQYPQHPKHHQQHPQHQQQHLQHQQQHLQHQPPQFQGVQSLGSGLPYQGHNTRGKDIIARIREEEPSSSSSDDDCRTNNTVGRNKFSQGYNQISTGDREQHRDDMYLCPDCGEYHQENAVSDVQEICPDCGVAHNPYQHTPSQNNAFRKYTDACRNVMKPSSKQYEKVSTEQDPEDVRQDTLPSIEGPHTEDDLMNGVRYKLKYLGSCQITTQHPVTKETRMQQAQDAFTRIKGQDDEDDDDVSTNVDMFISLERIKIINKDTKFEDVMMDHALRTICFICDMGNVLVLMARRLTSDHATDFSIEQGKPISLGSIVGDREKKTSKNICHVFEGEYEASKIAKAIGQAFNIAYRQFLQSNGIAHEHVEEAEYCHVLESQKLVGQDLDKLTDQSSARDIVVTKRRGDPLGIMLLESGWGSMLPTVFIAHLANYSAAARSQRLTVGDHILTCNGASLVGLPLSECSNILKNTRSSERVIFRVVSCPPVVDVVVSRPDTKYQLGFSVQNGTICSLLRGGIAERGGVRVGHRIIEINGDSVVAKSHQYIVDILANTTGSISMKTMPVAMYRLMVGDDLPLHV